MSYSYRYLFPSWESQTVTFLWLGKTKESWHPEPYSAGHCNNAV
jgi:hypothetical protein